MDHLTPWSRTPRTAQRFGVTARFHLSCIAAACVTHADHTSAACYHSSAVLCYSDGAVAAIAASTLLQLCSAPSPSPPLPVLAGDLTWPSAKANSTEVMATPYTPTSRSMAPPHLMPASPARDISSAATTHCRMHTTRAAKDTAQDAHTELGWFWVLLTEHMQADNKVTVGYSARCSTALCPNSCSAWPQGKLPEAWHSPWSTLFILTWCVAVAFGSGKHSLLSAQGPPPCFALDGAHLHKHSCPCHCAC